MARTISRCTEFNYNDLIWSEARVANVKEEAKTFCAEHNGIIEHVAGHLSYWRSGEPFYSDPECWPKFVVYWEENTEEEEV